MAVAQSSCCTVTVSTMHARCSLCVVQTSVYSMIVYWTIILSKPQHGASRLSAPAIHTPYHYHGPTMEWPPRDHRAHGDVWAMAQPWPGRRPTGHGASVARPLPSHSRDNPPDIAMTQPCPGHDQDMGGRSRRQIMPGPRNWLPCTNALSPNNNRT